MTAMPHFGNRDIRTSGVEFEYQRNIDRIRAMDIPKQNKDWALELDNELRQEGKKVASRNSVLHSLRFLLMHAGQKSLKDLQKSDFLEFFDRLERKEFSSEKIRKFSRRPTLSTSSMNGHKFQIKRFMAYIYGLDKANGYEPGECPPCVKWIKVKEIKGATELSPSDLLTPDEVKKMIECTKNPRDRSLLSFIAETGCRSGEASTLLIEGVERDTETDGFYAKLEGKTGKRRVYACLCAADMRRWIYDFHPMKNSAQCPVFLGYRSLQPTNLKTGSILAIIQDAARRAGINKRVYTHLLRHGRASELTNLYQMPTTVAMKHFGWKSPRTPMTYIHTSDTDMRNSYRKMHGKSVPKEEEKSGLKDAPECPKCNKRSPNGYSFCMHCHTNFEEEKERVKIVLNVLSSEQDLSERFKALVEEANRRMQVKAGHDQPSSDPQPPQL